MSEEDKTRGLYHKFDITRTDGKDKPGKKHHGCEYFVLDVTDDPLALPALAAYALAAKKDYPMLAQDLEMKLSGRYERSFSGRLVVSEEAARAEVARVWPAINVKGFELACGHDVLKHLRQLREALIVAIQGHDTIARDTVLCTIVGLCLQWFYQDYEFSEKLSEIQDRLVLLMRKKGPRAFVSSHEILGVLMEEFFELKDAVIDPSPSEGHVKSECMDIALGAIFGLVSANLGGLEW